MNIAIIGTGGIAHKMARTVTQLPNVNLYAVVSRHLEKAAEFSTVYNIPHFYCDYYEMIENPFIDLIYIALPHTLHYKYVKKALEKKKNVLCEKPLAINSKEAKILFEISKRNGCLLAEAMWTRYMPSRRIINNIINDNIIGNVSFLTANLGYPLQHIDRMKDLRLGAGALLDLAVYPINFMLMSLGSGIETIQSFIVKDTDGIDIKNAITFFYKNGILATVNSNITSYTDRRGIIAGDKGYIEAKPINNCQLVNCYDCNHKIIATYEMPNQITGYEYEIFACQKAIYDGQYECEEMTHKDSLMVLEILDHIREEWNILYPNDLQP